MRAPGGCASQACLGLYKILFYFEAYVHASIISLLPPPTRIAHTIALLVHDYYAIYDLTPTRLVHSIHRTILFNIGHANIVSRPKRVCMRNLESNT